jgi:hypothetical protein
MVMFPWPVDGSIYSISKESDIADQVSVDHTLQFALWAL